MIAAILSTISFYVQAQRGPLRGTGKVITKTISVRDFDKLNFEDLDGNIEVEIGKPFSVKIDIDENLEPLLYTSIEEKEYELTIGLKGNKNNKLYVEDTRIKVKITMPEASVIRHRGNNSLSVTGIIGRYFRLENEGNGTAILQGMIDDLDIKKNGKVKAQKLVAKMAKVKSYGNGNVQVNTQISLTAHGSGNNSVMQFGPGKIDPISGIMGNGEVRKM